MQRDCIHTGDCFDVLGEMDAESVHAVVTDPPYGLAFMGRSWDDFEPKEYQQFCEDWARECKRVLKPGGHLLAFSGNRTHHRLFTGVEDAGFEIRDTLTWHYGSGFPKASDISKTIDKRADKEGDYGKRKYKTANYESKQDGWSRPRMDDPDKVDKQGREYQPATDAAKRWDGWKTGLKPATEYVVMARKPFDGATVDCVLENETGALNIEGCRIETDEELSGGATTDKPRESDLSGDDRTDAGKGMFAEGSNPNIEPAEGRYPSNVVFDEAEAERLDEQVGELDTGDTVTRSNSIWGNASDGDGMDGDGYEDTGGPSRYFYTSKASKAERTLDGRIDNAHPTVKPQDLMEWLVRLVTREGQIVLDPFCGSGTTCKAAKELGREFVGVEKQAKWADVARARCGLTPEDPATVRERDDQTGLEAYQ